jgi:hypothetical protein
MENVPYYGLTKLSKRGFCRFCQSLLRGILYYLGLPSGNSDKAGGETSR